MKNFSIIGAGKVGTSLGNALAKSGYILKSLSCLTLAEAEESYRIIGQGESSENNIQTAQSGNILFITVPDDRIKEIVRELSTANIIWQEKIVFHCSGLLPSAVLGPLKEKGARTASFHPIQSFPNKHTAPSLFQDIYIGLEGEEEAIHTAKEIVQNLGGNSLRISSEDKPKFHAAFSMTSNFLVVLFDAAVNLLKSSGLSEDKAVQILKPLLEGTVNNIVDSPTCIRSALTGPIVRGDGQTVIAHLSALEKFPEVESVYRQLALKTVALAKEEKTLSEQKIKELFRILEDK